MAVAQLGLVQVPVAHNALGVLDYEAINYLQIRVGL